MHPLCPDASKVECSDEKCRELEKKVGEASKGTVLLRKLRLIPAVEVKVGLGFALICSLGLYFLLMLIVPFLFCLRTVRLLLASRMVLTRRCRFYSVCVCFASLNAGCFGSMLVHSAQSELLKMQAAAVSKKKKYRFRCC